MKLYNDILQFWFGEIPGEIRKAWFQKNPEFDATIRARFLSAYHSAVEGKFSDWTKVPDSALALCILLDQFPRNMFRQDAKSFASDSLALSIAKEAIEQGFDQLLPPIQRLFFYLPLEHSEDLPDQEACTKLVQPLTALLGTDEFFRFAVKHRDIIACFGRFPHRNALLGRQSSAEELEFLVSNPGF